jgi:hypothetical protein
MKTGQQVVAQPIGAVDAKDVGDGVKQIEKSISDCPEADPDVQELRREPSRREIH